MSDHTITIFSDVSHSSRRPTSFGVSALVHGFAFGLLTFGIMHSPRVVSNDHGERYFVRNLELDAPELAKQFSGHEDEDADRTGSLAESSPVSAALQAYLQTPPLRTGRDRSSRTLVQPDVPLNPTLLKELEIPSLVIWLPSKSIAKAVSAPVTRKPSAADVRPSITPPSQDLRLSDVSISPAPLATLDKWTSPATTSPIAIHEQNLPQAPPATVLQQPDQPSPSAILSISELHLERGPVVIPLAGRTQGSGGTNATTAERSQPVLQAHGDHPSDDGKSDRNEPSLGTKGSGQSHDLVSGPDQPGRGQEPGNNFGTNPQVPATRISLPKNGRFEAVVVGASLIEQYPETEDLWNGRLAYTVYVSVGLAKSWVLQYALPPLAQAAAGGTVDGLEAPWPYSIVRPELVPGSINADAVIVKGSIGADGHFENLKLIFPPSLRQARYILDCLWQWQFRPAVLSGQPARVEMLLIIPDTE